MRSSLHRPTSAKPLINLTEQDARYGAQAQRHQRGLVPCVTRVHGSMAYQDGTALSNGTDTASYQRVKVAVTTDASDLRMVVGNFYWGTAGPNQITVTAAIETATASYPVTFNGKLQAVLDSDAELISDPGCVPVTVKKGDALWLRTYVSVASVGQKWPLSAYYWQTNDDRVSTTSGDITGNTGPSGATLASVYVRAFAPAGVLGVPTDPTIPVFAIWGDSELVSLNDWNADFFRGWAERALNGQYAYANVSRHSSHVSQMLPVPAVGSSSPFLPADYRHRLRMALGATHALSGFGVNDIATDTVAVVETNLVAHWTDLAYRGLKAWQYTLPPRTTSTNFWTDLAGQTATANETNRVALNTWIRAGAPIDPTTKAPVAVGTVGALLAGQTGHPLKGYVETADQWESARNSGKWKIPERTVTDAAITSGAAVLTSATAAFTAADRGKSVVILGAGVAGAALSGAVITTVNSATSVTLLQTASTTVTGATAYIGCYTGDGLHPDKTGHVNCAAALTAAGTIATIAAS